MTITREGLYGGGEASATAAAGADAGQVASWRIPRGDPPDAPLAPPFVARSIALDNATGRWWRVAGRWIPPWTVGAVVPVVPPSSQLTVEAVTPAGQLSEAAGTELVVVANSDVVPSSPGIYTPPASGFSLYHTRTRLVVTTSGGAPTAVQIVTESAAGYRVALRRVRATVDWDSGNRHTPSTVTVGWMTGAGLAGLATATVSWGAPHSPEQTFDPPLLWPAPGDAGVLNAGLYALGQQVSASSPAAVILELDYLLAEAG